MLTKECSSFEKQFGRLWGGGGAVPRKYCNIYAHLSLENAFPLLKLTRNCTYIWTSFFSWKFHHKLAFALLNTYHLWKNNSTASKNMKENFGNQPVCMKSSFIRHCCFNSNLQYVRGVVSNRKFPWISNEYMSNINPNYSVGPLPTYVLVVIILCQGSDRITFIIGKIFR